MALQFILGRAGTGKTTWCYQAIRQAIAENKGESLILLVPEQATFQNEKALLAALGTDGMIQAQVLSFKRMAFRVLQEAGGAARAHIGELGKRMVLRKLLEHRKKQLQVFQRAAGQPGFCETLAGTLAELKIYRISPEDLKQSRELVQAHQGAGLLAQKLADLSLLYGDLENFLAGCYTDPEDYLNLLAEKLGQAVSWPGAAVWVDGFTGFTPQELAVLEKLLLTAGQVYVALCLDPHLSGPGNELDVFNPVRETMTAITELAWHNGVTVAEPVLLDRGSPRFNQAPALAYLERCFFQRPAEPFTGSTEQVQVAAAVNRRAEVEGAAREILRLCRDGGYRWREIVVSVRHLEQYLHLFNTVFADYGIPVFIDHKRPVLHHPVVELIRAALEVLTGNWAPDPVFRYLKTDLVPVSREQVDLLENYVLAHGIRGSRWTEARDWQFRRSYNLAGEEELARWEAAELKLINEIKVKARSALVKLQQKTKGSPDVRVITTALYELLAELAVPEQLASWSSQAAAAGQLAVAREHAQVWGGITGLLDQLVESLADEVLSLEAYAQVLNAGLDSLRLGLIPPGLDQVLVGSLERTRYPGVKANFMLGVNDGVLPARCGEDGIFLDAERELLWHWGLHMAPGSRRKLFDEQYLIYQALTRASHLLWLSYPLADEEGRALTPANLINRVKELLPALTETIIAQEPTDALAFTATPRSTLSYLSNQLREFKSGQAIDPAWWDVYNWYSGHGETLDQLPRRVLAGLFDHNQPAGIKPGLSRMLYGTPLKASVSRLEKYRHCPFAHFLSYGLRLKERPVFKLAAPDLGQFFHGALKMFADQLEAAHSAWDQLDQERCRELVDQVAEALTPRLQHEILLSTARYRYLIRKLKRTLVRSTMVLAEHARRGRFRPVGLELAFGPGRRLPAITLRLSNGLVLELSGQIDRVDLAAGEQGNYLRIIDYKSGQSGVDLADIYYGLKLQLLTYLDVVLTYARELAGADCRPGGMFYFYVRDPLVATGGPVPEETARLMILKELKLKGMLLADPDLVQLMDNQAAGAAGLLPVQITAKGELRQGAPIFTDDQFRLLRKHLHRLIKAAGEEIMAGEVAMRPYRKGQLTGCQYCSFQPVCRFDPVLGENSFNLILKEDRDSLWQQLAAGEEVNHD